MVRATADALVSRDDKPSTLIASPSIEIAAPPAGNQAQPAKPNAIKIQAENPPAAAVSLQTPSPIGSGGMLTGGPPETFAGCGLAEPVANGEPVRLESIPADCDVSVITRNFPFMAQRTQQKPGKGMRSDAFLDLGKRVARRLS